MSLCTLEYFSTFILYNNVLARNEVQCTLKMIIDNGSTGCCARSEAADIRRC